MITLKEKYQTVNHLKGIVVKCQKYEFAAWLRDIEKSILNELLNELGYEVYPIDFDGKLNYNQYHYAIELISTYENKYNYNEQQFVEILKKSYIDFIRDQKIDDLLG